MRNKRFEQSGPLGWFTGAMPDAAPNGGHGAILFMYLIETGFAAVA